MRLEVIAPAGLELREEVRRPVGVALGVIHFIGVVEIVADLADVVALECLVEFLEIAVDGLGGKMVDDVTLAAWSGTLHEFAVPA